MKVGGGGCQEKICSFDGVAPVGICERQGFDFGYEFAEEVSRREGEICVLEVAELYQGALMLFELFNGNFPAESKFNAPQGIKRIPVRVHCKVCFMKFSQVVVDLTLAQEINC